ncbi:phage terminase large subunit-like protein [Aquimarina sp. EL_43]|uniref:hypothetical protein n=1 Tax=unclassified Aquimarina TaxID=2627091 RepID=UPI0018CA5358|nr:MULTISPECIES: hypothetical protein [unclassified Aquimarina]MBG6130069.1 phage terminase large subunit-like protein [Aquimarina sp. EL_35]MBG6148849.1 phage terminase large subunit-like protein [Aquimarina sp. EL_32]MBG6168777.1 phage terminase large subunit-like protein [Aquimarina sp. EL_43]
MTSGLRKTHKIIWIVLIIIMPVLIVLSIKSIKEPLLTDDDLSLTPILSGQRIVLDDDSFFIGVKEQNSLNALQIILKKPLKSASSLVYGVLPSEKKDTYLGVLDKKGVYMFEIDKQIRSIRIYDEIKKSDIVNIEL